MTGVVLGIDTSCYTTSVALAKDGAPLAQKRRLLTVEAGERGLQQSEGVFQHVGRLPQLLEALMAEGDHEIAAVCASARPRPVEGSYMPVFTVGEGYGRAIAAALRVPFFETSHQEGHIRAALVDAGVKPGRFLALHLSGGTTELIRVDEGRMELVGETGDLNAGQFIDRVGVALGLPFPAGAHLELLALKGQAKSLFPASVQGLKVSFSGAETQAQRLIAQNTLSREDMAAEVFSLVTRNIAKLFVNALAETGIRQFLLAGGVASSSLLKTMLPERLSRYHARVCLHWARPEFSGDNAVGVALIGSKLLEKEDVQ